MNNWNTTARIKSILILVISLIPLFFISFNKNTEFVNNSYLGISAFVFIFTILFLPLITKFWSLFGIEFKKPNWNENPLSLNFSKSMNFFQFGGYWFITSGITKILFVGIFYQKFHGESFMIFVYGISLIIGIKLSLKWLNKGGKKKKKTVANTVYN